MGVMPHLHSPAGTAERPARALDAGRMSDGPFQPETTPTVRKTNSGAGRVLVAVYGIFALAATADGSGLALTDALRLLS